MPNFVVPTSVSAFWLGGGLDPNIVHSESAMVLVPLSLPFTCDVSFHYNDGITSSGAFFSGQMFLHLRLIWF